MARHGDAVDSVRPPGNLRIGNDRIRLYGVGLFFVGMSQLRFVASVGKFWDWIDFYVAGATVGTRALLDPAERAAWGAAHRLSVTAFMYMPGFAWLLSPAAQLSLAWGFAANGILMLFCCGLAVVVASACYTIPRRVALLSIIGWAPVTAAIVTGQNSLLGMLLALLIMRGIVGERPVFTGLAAGALLYKPTYAAPFVLLFLIRKQWKTLGVVACCGIVWYVASVTATGGDWMWPLTYLRSMTGYVGPDFVGNRFKSVSLPGVLMLLGAPHALAYAAGGALLIAGLASMKRVSLLEAASMMTLIGLASSPHAWPYDAAIIVPAVFWVMSEVEEPWRTRLIAVAYAIAPTWLLSNMIHFDLLSALIIGGAGAWIWRQSTQRSPRMMTSRAATYVADA
jgi:hypothetical protein